MAYNVGDVLARAGQNAGALEHSNQQTGAQASAFDVWTRSYEGMSERMRDFAADPAGTLASYPRDLDNAVAAGLTGDWQSSSSAGVADSIAAQAAGLGNMVTAVGEAQGALATAGAAFALLTGVEQMLSTLVSVIPFPALPAIRITDMDIGLPHAHSHPPNLPPPPPIPLPSTGPIIPIPIMSGATRTLINGMPAARCGDMGLGIWCGGYFPMYEVFLGSSNVWVEGARAGRLAVDITKHCIFTTPKPGDPPIGPMVGVTITASSNVLIGGVPMPSLVSLAIGAAIRGIAKGLSRLAGAARSGFSRLTQRIANRWPQIKCFFTGCPVNIVSGETLVAATDFSAQGLLPLVWTRTYRTSVRDEDGVLGHGWKLSMAFSLRVGARDAILVEGDGRELAFVLPPVGEQSRSSDDEVTLLSSDHSIVLSGRGGERIVFEPVAGPSSPWCPTGIESGDGGALVLRYDRGRLVFINGAEPYDFHISYDGAGRIESVERQLARKSSPLEPVVRYVYDAAGDLVRVSDRSGAACTYQYLDHHLVRETSRTGFSFHYEYDDEGRCVRTWGDDGLFDHRLTFDSRQKRTTVTDSRGHETVFEYNEQNLVTAITSPDGGQVSYTYDQTGTLQASIDAVGRMARYVHDGQRRPIVKIDEVGRACSRTYDGRGRPASVTSPVGAASLTYSDEPRMCTITDALGGSCEVRLDRAGRVAQLADSDGRRLAFTYNRFGRIEESRLDDELLRRYEYDARGRLTRIRERGDVVTRISWDDLDRPVSMERNGAEHGVRYDADHRIVESTGPDGRVERITYRALDKVARYQHPDGSEHAYEYDTELNLVGMTNALGERARFVYDGCERLTREHRFDGTVVRFEYDMIGRLIAHVPPHGRPVRLQYDAVGNLVGRFRGDDSFVRYTFRENELTVSSNDSSVHLLRDRAGRLVQERQESGTVSYEYDRASRLLRTEIAGQGEIQYRYDARGPLRSVVDPAGLEHLLEYGPRGQLIRHQVADTCLIQYEFSKDDLLVRQQVAGGGSDWFREYEYSSSGQLQRIKDSELGTARFAYDNCDRLVGCREFDGTERRWDTRQQGGPWQSLDEPTRWLPGGRLAQFGDIGYEYDDAGRVIALRRGARAMRLTWNDADQLVSLDEAGVVTRYRYDPFGRRIAKSHKGKEHRFLWSCRQLLGELREGAWTLFVPLPDSFLLVGALASARSIICVNGHNGQPIRLLDSNGTVVSAPCCTAHGRLLRDRPEALTFAIRFLGQYHDVESDLHYNFRRYYDPHTGRYLTPDPLGYLQDVDLYAYGKNPVNYADPLGLGPHVCYRFLRAAAEDLIDRSAALQRLRSLYGRLDELGEAGLRRELDDLTDWLRRTQGIEVRPVPRGSVFDELMGLSDSNPGRIAGDSTIFIRDDVFATPRRALDEISHEVGAIELNRHFTRAPVIASGPGRAARSRWPTVAEDARYSDLASPRSATHVIDEAVQGDRLSPDHAGSFWNRVHGT